MHAAGLDYQQVLQCAHNTSLVAQVQKQLNSTRAAMYNSLGPEPGLFPHIFVNGRHLFNNTWAAMVRLLCEELEGVPSACKTVTRTLSFTVQIPGVTVPQVQQAAAAVESAVQSAVDFVVSNVSFPLNFNTDELDGAPSYVNVQAVVHTQLRQVQGLPGAVRVQLQVATLEWFASDLDRGCLMGIFPKFLAWATSQQLSFDKWPAASIKEVHVGP